MVDIKKWLFGDRAKALAEGQAAAAEERLQPFAARILETELPYIAVSTSSAAPRSAAGSQLGGYPWWPDDRPYPRANNGSPLFLLAQINFSEVPRLDPFPVSGLLQFFIAADDLYGCDFEDPRKAPGFACVYHDRIAGRRLADLGFLQVDPDRFLPLSEPLEPHAMTFTLERMTVDPGDYRFAQLLPEIDGDDELREAYHQSREVSALRLGGYPSFTQTDPRSYGDAARYGDFTLFTADTTDGLMWGDSGVAQFFIHEDDLKRRDFSRVAYNWDCC